MLWLLWAAIVLVACFGRIVQLVQGDIAVWQVLRGDGFLSLSHWIILGLGAGLYILPGSPHEHFRSGLIRRVSIPWRVLAVAGGALLAMVIAGLAGWRIFLPLLFPNQFPAADEASSRAIEAIIGAAAVFVAAQVFGAILLTLFRWNFQDWRERVLLRTILGLGAISYLSFALALAGVYTPPSVRMLVVGTIIAGVVWNGPSFLRWVRHPAAIAATLQAIETQTHDRFDRIWKTISFLACLVAFIAALAPETEYDALWYHLQLPRVWLAHGNPVDIVHEYVSLYPMNWELVLGAGTVMGGPVAAKLLHYACLPLLGLLVVQFARRFLQGISPWLAAALCLTAPTVLWEASTAYSDLAVAFSTGMVLYSIFAYLESGEHRWLLMAGTCMGIALGTKNLALLALVAAVVVLSMRLWLMHRRLSGIIRPVTYFLLVALLLSLPWYLRSYVASGNPVFPDLYHVFGASPPERWSEQTERGLQHFKDNFGRPRSAVNLVLLPWDMTAHAARYGAAPGPLFLLFLPALLLVRGKGPTTRWLLLFLGIYVLLWASPLSSFQGRFLIPIVPVLALVTATAFNRLAGVDPPESRWHGGKLAAGIMVFVMFLNLPPAISLQDEDRLHWTGWLTHVIRRLPTAVVSGKQTGESYLTKYVPAYAAWQYINRNLPADARVLTFEGGDHFYAERARLLSDATAAHPAVWGAMPGKEEETRAALRRLGITHILFDKNQMASGEPGQIAIGQRSFQERWFLNVYEDDRFVLYRLRNGG